MELDFQDKIDEYILDRMSDEDRAQFEVAVNQDGTKREQLDFTRDVKAAVSSREEKLARLRVLQEIYDNRRRQEMDDCQSLSTPQYTAEKKPLNRLWWWVSGVAAVLVIGVLVVNTFHESSLCTEFTSEKIINNSNYSFGIDSSETDNYIKKDTIPGDSIMIMSRRSME